MALMVGNMKKNILIIFSILVIFSSLIACASNGSSDTNFSTTVTYDKESIYSYNTANNRQKENITDKSKKSTTEISTDNSKKDLAKNNSSTASNENDNICVFEYSSKVDSSITNYSNKDITASSVTQSTKLTNEQTSKINKNTTPATDKYGWINKWY